MSIIENAKLRSRLPRFVHSSYRPRPRFPSSISSRIWTFESPPSDLAEFFQLSSPTSETRRSATVGDGYSWEYQTDPVWMYLPHMHARNSTQPSRGAGPNTVDAIKPFKRDVRATGPKDRTETPLAFRTALRGTSDKIGHYALVAFVEAERSWTNFSRKPLQY